tara:strand:+ start:4822 stop:5016 length:195 start_codon:yes stop_codon:yes gene_type:complete
MKRYILFSGDDYYPAGGMKDLRGYFDTKGGAIDAFEEWKEKSIWDVDWHQIYDTETGTIEDSRD